MANLDKPHQTILSKLEVGIHTCEYDMIAYFPVFYEVYAENYFRYTEIKRKFMLGSLYSVCFSSAYPMYDSRSRKTKIKFYAGMQKMDAVAFKLTYDCQKISLLPNTMFFSVMVKESDNDIY